MCRLPITHPLLGTWPETQACAMTGNRTGDQSTEPHQPGLKSVRFCNIITYSSLVYILPGSVCLSEFSKETFCLVALSSGSIEV